MTGGGRRGRGHRVLDAQLLPALELVGEDERVVERGLARLPKEDTDAARHGRREVDSPRLGLEVGDGPRRLARELHHAIRREQAQHEGRHGVAVAEFSSRC